MAYGSIAPPKNLAPLPILAYTLPDRRRMTCYPVTAQTAPVELCKFLHDVFNEELASKPSLHVFNLLPLHPHRIATRSGKDLPAGGSRRLRGVHFLLFRRDHYPRDREQGTSGRGTRSRGCDSSGGYFGRTQRWALVERLPGWNILCVGSRGISV